jgi:hypothetical protein
MNASHKSVQNYIEAVESAQFIRNLSADAILVIASLVSGGSAMALVGAGSIAKGAATYQDTGNIGAATVKAIGTLALGAIPIKAAKGVLDNKLFLILGSGVVDGSTTFVAGGDLRDALASGGAAMFSQSPLVNDVLTKGLINSAQIPLHLIVGQAVMNRSSEDFAQRDLNRLLKKSANFKPALAETKLIRRTPDVPKILARLAILDTDPRRGIASQVM